VIYSYDIYLITFPFEIHIYVTQKRNPPTPGDAVRQQKKKYFRGSFQFSIVIIKKKYHPSGNRKFNYLGIFQSLKLRILMEKIPQISRELNFTPHTLACYGLT